MRLENRFSHSARQPASRQGGQQAAEFGCICLDRLRMSNARDPHICECRPSRSGGRCDWQGLASDYQLHTWVVMPNHIHLLITPQAGVLAKRRLKGTSARESNKLLGQTGRRSGG